MRKLQNTTVSWFFMGWCRTSFDVRKPCRNYPKSPRIIELISASDFGTPLTLARFFFWCVWLHFRCEMFDLWVSFKSTCFDFFENHFCRWRPQNRPPSILTTVVYSIHWNHLRTRWDQVYEKNCHFFHLCVFPYWVLYMHYIRLSVAAKISWNPVSNLDLFGWGCWEVDLVLEIC